MWRKSLRSIRILNIACNYSKLLSQKKIVELDKMFQYDTINTRTALLFAGAIRVQAFFRMYVAYLDFWQLKKQSLSQT